MKPTITPRVSRFFSLTRVIPARLELAYALGQFVQRQGYTNQPRDFSNHTLVIQQVYYWTDPYKAYHRYRPERARLPGDPRWHFWVYNTYTQWAEDFPNLHPGSLRRIFTSLRDWGILLSAEPGSNHHNLQGLFWAIDHDRLDEIFEQTEWPRSFTGGPLLPPFLLNTFEEVDSDWHLSTCEDTTRGRANGATGLTNGACLSRESRVPSAQLARGERANGAPSPLYIDQIKDHEKDQRSESTIHEGEVSDLSDSSTSEYRSLTQEEKNTNTAMLRDESLGLNWSRTIAQFVQRYHPHEICAVVIRAHENRRQHRIYDMAGWIVKVLKSPEPGILDLWEEDELHWFYRKHILKESLTLSEKELTTPDGDVASIVTSCQKAKSTSEAEAIWQKALEELALQIPSATFETWLRDTEGIFYADSTFVIGVPNPYALEWLGNRIRPHICRILNRITQETITLSFQVRSGST